MAAAMMLFLFFFFATTTNHDPPPDVDEGLVPGAEGAEGWGRVEKRSEQKRVKLV